jgi:hypothetical protein
VYVPCPTLPSSIMYEHKPHSVDLLNWDHLWLRSPVVEDQLWQGDSLALLWERVWYITIQRFVLTKNRDVLTSLQHHKIMNIIKTNLVFACMVECSVCGASLLDGSCMSIFGFSI